VVAVVVGGGGGGGTYSTVELVGEVKVTAVHVTLQIERLDLDLNGNQRTSIGRVFLDMVILDRRATAKINHLQPTNVSLEPTTQPTNQPTLYH
jgi:hypothetical protein